MTRLLLKGTALLVFVVLSCVATIMMLPDPSNPYFRIAATKWEIADTTRSPKLLIVGGSNTAFGLDSRLLSQELGRPAVNLGLNAGLGLRYMLSEAAPFVRAGDVVLISPEYEQFYGDLLNGRSQLLELAWLHPPALRRLRAPGQGIALARGFPHVVQARLRSMWLDFRSPGRALYDEVYNVGGFNEHGDMVSHLGVESEKKVADMALLDDDNSKLNHDAVRLLNRFAADAERRGARVLLLLPTIPQYHYRQHAGQMRAVYEMLLEESDVPVLAPPAEHVAPDAHFFDTAYHLGAPGREARTKKAIELLRGAAGFGQVAHDR